MLEQLIKALPENPGVYIMYNSDNQVIYVGKAKNLKNRVTQYFRSNSSHSTKVRAMVKNVERFEYIITATEFEALTLECNLIKQYMPKYNILLKDDKAHPYLKVTLNEKYPRFVLARRVMADGAKYFGPYQSSNVIYSTIDLLRNIFKIRSCNTRFNDTLQRPCLNYQIGKCCSPCSGNVTEDEYNKIVNEAIMFIEGKNDSIVQKLQLEMEEASKNLQYEKAASLRDTIVNINTMRQKQNAINVNLENSDVLAFDRSGSLVCIQVFFVRDGKIIGREHYFVKDIEQSENSFILSEFVKQYYALQSIIPRNIYIQTEIDDKALIENWLSDKNNRKVLISVPKRGDKLKYIKMAEKNAREELKLKLLEDDRNSKKLSDIMFEIKDMFGLSEVPVNIEAYDISNLSGADNIGVMVSYENGVPVKNRYKKFNIRSVNGQDDYMSMREVIYRRISNGQNNEKGFIPMPDLILLDGGSGHLSSVMEVMDFLKCDIPVFGVVKDDKHKTRGVVSVNGEIQILPTSNVFKFLFKVQEEVHRFAINSHRSKRKKSMLNSELLEIKGIGKQKHQMLLKHFKSMKAIKNATIKQLTEVKGIDENLAHTIYNKFHQKG